MSSKKPTALKFDPQSLDWIGLRLVVVANRYVNSLYPEIERHHGLQRDVVALLVCLSITKAATAQEVVRYTGRPKNSISRAVNGLEQAGLLSRSTHPLDGRAASLALTAKGRRTATLIGERAAEHDARMLAKLNQEDRREFTRLLNIMSDPG